MASRPLSSTGSTGSTASGPGPSYANSRISSSGTGTGITGTSHGVSGTSSRLSTAQSAVKPRQLSHLHSQLAQLEAHLADLENLLRMTAVQAEHIRELGGINAGLFMAAAKVLGEETVAGEERR